MTLNTQKSKIKEINSQIELMASLVEKQIYRAMLALKNMNIKEADEVIKEDDRVDELQKRIDEECIKFIATEQPLASDLRHVFTATKIVTDLERMADYAVDICKLSKRISKSSLTEFKESALALWTMEEKVREMITLGIKAYIEIDDVKAYEICKMDDSIDILYASIFEDILKAVKLKGDNITSDARLLFVAKYLERVADHVTNICEGIIYSKQGKYVDLNE